MTLIVTWLWQGLVVAWITAVAVRCMPRLNAATRHAVWWLALAAVLAIPVAYGLAAITTVTPSAPATDLPPLDAAGALMLPAIPGGVVACAAAIWAMTVAVGVLRIVGSCRAVGRLKRASSPFDRSREARLPLWVAARGRGHRAAELLTSDRMAGACALGLGRPVILVSRTLANALSDESLDEIVMHEQAHLDRYDDWSQLLLAVVGSLVGLHPAVRFLTRRLDVDREAACDDRVVSCTGAPRRYAASLLAVAAASNRGTGGIALTAAVPTATTTASALRVRVGRLLDPRRDRRACLASATSFVSVAALSLAVVLSTQVAPVVIFFAAAAVSVPAAESAIDESRALLLHDRLGAPSDPALGTNVEPAATGPAPPARRTITRLKRSTESDPTEAGVHVAAGTSFDAAPLAPLDSRIIPADATGPVLAVSPPPLQPAAIASAATDVASPWNAVGTSTTSAADGVARAAAATAARARTAGLSIGRFVTRASKAGARAF